jgi:hypothetical protein
MGACSGRSTTIVFQPNERARAFVETWVQLSGTAALGWVDQHTLIEAMAQVPDLSVSLEG